MCLFPAMPRFAPAGLWEPCCSPAAMLGSGHLMETFIPSAPLHHWAGLSKNASCSPHPAPALPAELWFLHPITGLPQGGHPRSDAEPQPHGMGSSGWTRVSWGGCSTAPAPRGWGLQQCLAHQTSQAANYILQRSQNYWDSFTCKLGSGGCSVAVLWEAEFGVIFR